VSSWLTPWIHLRPYSPGFYLVSSGLFWSVCLSSLYDSSSGTGVPYRLHISKLGYSCDCLRLHTRLDTSGEFLLCSRRFWIHRTIDIDSSDVVAHLHWYVSTNLRCRSGCCTKSTPVYVLATTSPQPQSPDYIWLTPWIHLRPYSPGFYPVSSWWHWRSYRLDVLKLGYSRDCTLPWIYPASR
jgi:hypothetical protein